MILNSYDFSIVGVGLFGYILAHEMKKEGYMLGDR